MILPLQNARFVFFFKDTLTFVNQKAIEGPDGQDLGMPVMDADTIRLWYFRHGKAFHASSTQSNLDSKRVVRV